MKKIGITGSEGYIGRAFVKAGCIPIVVDVTKKEETHYAVSKADVDVIIHCAAMTDVDACEKEFHTAFVANVQGTENVLQALNSIQEFYYLSTDHVFPGKSYTFGFHGYSENHEPSPINNYGYTKYGGEIVTKTSGHKSAIIRASKMFSWDTLQPHIAAMEDSREQVFSKLICRSFIHRDHFVSTVLDLITSGDVFRYSNNILNVAGNEILSYYQFWKLVADIYDLDQKLVVPREFALQGATPRPFVGGLNVGKLKSLGMKTYHPVDGIYLTQEEG